MESIYKEIKNCKAGKGSEIDYKKAWCYKMREKDRKAVLADAGYDMNAIAGLLVKIVDTVKEIQEQAKEAGSEKVFISYSPYVREKHKDWGVEIRIPKEYFDEAYRYLHPNDADETLRQSYLAVWKGLHLINGLNESGRALRIAPDQVKYCICMSVETYEFCKRLLEKREERERASHREQRQ